MNNFKQVTEQKIKDIQNSLTKELMEELQNFYNTHTNNETGIYMSEKFNCTKSLGKKLLNILPFVKKGKGANLTKENIEKALLKKYGVTNAAFIKGVTEKKKETCKKRYGVEHPLQDKNILEKAKKTNLDKYGFDNYRKTEECKRKIKETKKQKYGDNLEDVIKKIKDTKFINHGNSNYNNRKKAAETCLKKYGTESPMQNEKIKIKYKKTCLEKYDVENPMQLEKIYNKHWKRIYFDGHYFDSSWEVAFYIYYRDAGALIAREADKFEYLFEGKKHIYYCDFTLDGICYEIKSDYLLKKMHIKDTLENAKYNCLINNGVLIIDSQQIIKYLDYVNSKYGEGYLKEIRYNAMTSTKEDKKEDIL